MIPGPIIDIARKLRPELEAYPVEPQGGGILLSEMLLFLSACQHRGVTHIVESGRKYGYSTAILGEWAARHDGRIDSVEWAPLRDTDAMLRQRYDDRVSLLVGDGNLMVSRLCGRKSGLLMDGPKGYEAVGKIEACNPAVGAVHDVPVYESGDTPNAFRAWLSDRHRDALWSDDPAWLEEFAEMDRPYWSYGNNYRSREEMTRHAFTLCVMLGVTP